MLRLKHIPRLAVAAAATLLAGCATSSVEMAPERPDRPWSAPTEAGGEIIAGAPPAEPGLGKGGYVLPPNQELATPPAPDAVDKSHLYTLSDLVDLAQSTNPLTRVAWNDARQVALASGIAKSAYLPRLTAAAVGGYQTSTSRISGPLGGSSENSANGTISSVSLNWLLFDFGRRAAVVEAAEQASVISNIGFTAAHQKLIYEVSVAFYSYAAARARAGVARQSLENAKAVQDAAEDRLKRGIGTSIDASKAQQGTAQAKLMVVQTQGGEQDAYLALVTAVGLSPLTRIKIADVSDRKLDPGMAGRVEKTLSQALAQRPDILAAYAAQKAAQADVRAAEADFMPKIFMAGTGSYSAGGLYLSQLPSIGTQGSIGNFSNNGLGATVFGGVTMPLYDGGTRSAMLQQAQAKSENAALKLEHTRHEALRQIVQAQNTLKTAIAAHEAAGAVVSSSKTTFDAALAAYRSGVGSITDVTLAQTQHLQAKIVSTESHSAALSAAATLALASGSLGSAPE